MSMASEILAFITKQMDLALQFMASCELQTVTKLTCIKHFLTLIIIHACFILQELKLV